MAMKCAYHPERDAVGACINCGKLVCDECKAVLGGKIYCNSCANKIILGESEARVNQPKEQPVTVGKPEGQQAINVVQEMVTQRFLEGKNKKKIVEELIQGGLAKESATQYVDNLELQFKQSPEGRQRLASNYTRHMLYGVLWIASGVIATMVIEGWFFWGAIVFGLYDFFKGFFGWLKYR